MRNCLFNWLKTPVLSALLLKLGGSFAILALLLPLSLSAQGTWTPANADPSFPRTLIKTSELGDLRTYLLNPEPAAIFQSLWSDLQSYSPPAVLDNNGKRRRASFIAKNAAFFHLLDRKPGTNGLDTLTSAESIQLRDQAITTLERMITNVEIYPNFNEYLWRSNELINNAIAWDLLKGAGTPDSLLAPAKALLMEYAGNLYEQASFDLFGLGFLSLHVDNHALRTCGALGLTAIVLADENDTNSDRQPRNWFNLALFNIDNVFWTSGASQSATGTIAGYSEGPHYLRFGSKHVLPFFHALGNFIPDDTTMTISYNGGTRNIRHPWHDSNYDLLFEWVLRIGMPDGRNPALEDAFVATAWEELAIWEKPEYSPKVDYSRWAHVQPGSLWQMLHHSTDDVVADYLCAMTPDNPASFESMQTLAESGNLVYRNRWDSSATYMHFTSKNGRARTAAQGHNQGDASSFILFAHGELLAIDPGYLKWDRRDEVGQADNHNLILVDGAGPATGTTASANGADAFIERSINLEGLKYAEVRTNYEGADIVRKSMMVHGQHFLLADDIRSTSGPHDYTYQLHGYGLENGDSLTGYFTDISGTGQALYQKGGVELLATLTADGGVDTYGKLDQGHEWKYDSLQYHTTFRGTISNSSNGKFLSSLLPYTTDIPVVNQLCSPACGGISVNQAGYIDVASVSGTATTNELPGTLSGDGDLIYYSQDTAGTFVQLLFENGTDLSLGAMTLCSTTVQTDFAMEVTDTATYNCYMRDGGTIYLSRLNFEPQSVNGFSVQSWQYNIPNQTLEVQLGAGGYFTIHEGVVIALDDPLNEKAIQLGPNPTDGPISIALEEGAGEILILDVNGRLVKYLRVNEKEFQLDLSAEPAGLYLLEWHRTALPGISRKIVKR